MKQSIKLNNDEVDYCDECNKEVLRDMLVNLHPDANESLQDLKPEYLEYDGMVCEDCYIDMHK